MLKMLHSATVLHSATDKLTTENHDQSDSNDGRQCVLVCWSCKAILKVTVIVIVVVIVIVIVKMILREAVLVCWSCKAMRFSDGRKQQ